MFGGGIGLDEPIGWEPNDVLTLYRWSDCGRNGMPDWIDFHIARAFCSTALMRVADVHENRSPIRNDALSPLIESCLALGGPFRLRLLSQIVWSLGAMEPDDEERIYHAFGLLAAYALGPKPEAEAFERLGAWVAHVNPETFPEVAWRYAPFDRTVLGRTLGSASAWRWRSLAEGLRPLTAEGGELDRSLSLVPK